MAVFADQKAPMEGNEASATSPRHYCDPVPVFPSIGLASFIILRYGTVGKGYNTKPNGIVLDVVLKRNPKAIKKGHFLCYPNCFIA